MNLVALALYSGAALTDIAGTALGTYDLAHRVSKLRRYVRPVSTRVRSTWNAESGDISQILASREPAVIDARVRDAFHALTDDLYEERKAREDSEARLAQLVGAGDHLWRLWMTAVLLLLGVLLGSAGNLASTIGR